MIIAAILIILGFSLVMSTVVYDTFVTSHTKPTAFINVFTIYKYRDRFDGSEFTDIDGFRPLFFPIGFAYATILDLKYDLNHREQVPWRK